MQNNFGYVPWMQRRVAQGKMCTGGVRQQHHGPHGQPPQQGLHLFVALGVTGEGGPVGSRPPLHHDHLIVLDQPPDVGGHVGAVPEGRAAHHDERGPILTGHEVALLAGLGAEPALCGLYGLVS